MSQGDMPVLLGGTPLRIAPFSRWPVATGDELRELASVLGQEVWLDGATTLAFEHELARYLGASHVIAVNSGGMALQMAIRGLGLVPGDEVIVPVDTCVADAFAVFNAGAVPLFADTDPETLTLDWASVEETLGPRTRAVIVVHPWGRPADMDRAREVAERHGLLLIDDACQALGAEWRGRKAGTLGDVGIHSFGWMKPLQGGGGGAIVTADASTAHAMVALRAWGDRETAYGETDYRDLAWNGRLSEFVAAVLHSQLRTYPSRLLEIQANAARLERRLEALPGFSVLPADSRMTSQGYAKLLLKANLGAFGISLDTLAIALNAEGVPEVWHAAFHPLTELSFFAEGRWRVWAQAHPDPERLARNYARPYPGADCIYREVGLSIGRRALLSESAADDVAAMAERVWRHRSALTAWERAHQE